MAQTVILKWTEEHEWRVLVDAPEDGYSRSRAMEQAVNASGVFQRGAVDPGSITFEVREG